MLSESNDPRPKPEKALLIGVETEEVGKAEAGHLLAELKGLATSLGLEVAGEMGIKLRAKTANLLVGSGKADEIVEAAAAAGSDSIIFDAALSPVQQRNLEELTGKKVYDRSELIIKIFSSRALTKEAGLQVELARLEYALPRLAHSYEDLSRQRGGRYGTKGSGEQKIELDRRSIEKRIHEIKEELKDVIKARDVQRKKRDRIAIPTAAIVGYTNAGKSSLLNALTRAEVLAEDKLFATLDPTTRRLELTSGAALLLTDTVGFVRNLPHRLVDAFKATLEEAARADLLIHVADAADEEVEAHIATTVGVLGEIGAGRVDRVLVFNKIDAVSEEKIADLLRTHPGSLAASAKTGRGLPELVHAITERLTSSMKELVLNIPHAEYSLVALARREGVVAEEISGDDSTTLRCRLPERLLAKFDRYIQG